MKQFSSLALVPLVLAVSSTGCSGGYDPAGRYDGKSLSIVENFKPSAEKAPYGETFEPVEIKSLGGDLYEVHFGACAVKVKRPAKRDEFLWKLAGPEKCATKVGEVKIAEGHLQVWAEDDKVNLAFEGLTADDRYKVFFSTAPISRIR